MGGEGDAGRAGPGDLCVGVDVGGTFTDVVLSDGSSLWRAKASTTPHDVGVGVLEACRLVAERAGASLERLLPTVRRFGLGTTAVTNVLAARTGRTVGLLITAGFEDLLPAARGRREHEDGWLVMPPELVAREHIVGIAERVDRDGSVLRPLDLHDVVAASDRLVHDLGCDALAVSFLWSFRNPGHERSAAAALRERHPSLPVTAGSELDPVIREYERTTFAVLNAYAAGALAGVDALAARLAASGLTVPVLLVHSGGGSITVEEAHRVPIRLAASGPAAGVSAAVAVARHAGLDQAITCDLGGTSIDVSVVRHGQPQRRTRGDLMGTWTTMPMVDVVSLGAGGGSAAWIDARGMLRVGPRSAGAVPGPVCYGRGGTEPTVTDALLVLGFLDPGRFLGGAMALDVAAARDACARLGADVGLTPHETAWGIREVALAEMTKAVRARLASQGLDPREHPVVTYGGCGPLLAAAIAAAIGAPTVLVPELAAVLSAYGAASTDVRRERIASLGLVLPVEPSQLAPFVVELAAAVDADLAGDGIDAADRSVDFEVDLRFLRQRWELTVPLTLGADAGAAGAAGGAGALDTAALDRLVADFRGEYARRYGEGALVAGAPVELVALRAVGTGRTVRASLQRAPDPVPAGTAPPVTGTRPVRLDRTDGVGVDVPVLDGSVLRPGHVLDGPAVVDADDTTVWVPPGARLSVDPWRTIVLDLARHPVPVPAWELP